VLTPPALPLDELMRLRADLVNETRAPIDLVSLNDASIVLAHEVADSGRCLYTSTPDAEVDFVTRARTRYWDFKPYRDAQWRLAGERLAERRRGSLGTHRVQPREEAPARPAAGAVPQIPDRRGGVIGLPR
jgi:hypothetical protein